MRGVAVPYIIALILGVAVIGLIGYWFVVQGGKFGGQSAKTICDNKFLQWCITTGGTLAAFISSNGECNGLVSYSDCNELTTPSGGSSGSAIIGSGSPPSQPTCVPTGSSCTTGGTRCCENNDIGCAQHRGESEHTCHILAH